MTIFFYCTRGRIIVKTLFYHYQPNCIVSCKYEYVYLTGYLWDTTNATDGAKNIKCPIISPYLGT